MPRVTILSGLQISTNPRVFREADALTAAGFEVEVLGATLDGALVEQDRLIIEGKRWKYTPVIDVSSRRLAERLRSTFARGRTRAQSELFGLTGIATDSQLSVAGREMLAHARRRPADLYIAHNPGSLWVACELRAKGFAVAVDMEDWYSEDLLPEDRALIPAGRLRAREREMLREGSFALATSHAMSEALALAYGCEKPTVVYNSLPLSEREFLDGRTLDRVDRSLPSLCWFSQVTGPGRGLETLLDSLEAIPTPFELHLRGNCTPEYRDALLTRASERWRRRIHFHQQVPHLELLSRLAEHDIGFAGDIPYCLSRNVTITNKILSYLLAGIAVVASDTPGHREVAAASAGAVTIFAAGNPESLALNLNKLLSDSIALAASRRAAADTATGAMSWDHSRSRLVDAVDRATKVPYARRGATPAPVG